MNPRRGPLAAGATLLLTILFICTNPESLPAQYLLKETPDTLICGCSYLERVSAEGDSVVVLPIELRAHMYPRAVNFSIIYSPTYFEYSEFSVELCNGYGSLERDTILTPSLAAAHLGVDFVDATWGKDGDIPPLTEITISVRFRVLAAETDLTAGVPPRFGDFSPPCTFALLRFGNEAGKMAIRNCTNDSAE